MTNSLSGSEHDSLRDMIPWYRNGTLSETDTRRVAAHLENCRECRRDSADFNDMRAAVQSEELAPLIPSTRAADILKRDKPTLDRTNRNRLRPRFALAAAASLLAVALLISYNAGQRGGTERLFHTATSNSAIAGVDYILQMQFVAGLAETQRRQIVESLDSVGKWTVDENEVYEIHLRIDDPSLAGLEAYEKHLRSMNGVKSAEFIAMRLPVR